MTPDCSDCVTVLSVANMWAVGEDATETSLISSGMKLPRVSEYSCKPLTLENKPDLREMHQTDLRLFPDIHTFSL